MNPHHEEPANAVENRPVALLTGASEGFGRELAGLIARDGYDLIIVARGHARLLELADALERDCGANVEVRAFDLAQHDQQLELAALTSRQPNLKLVINNAACGAVGELALASEPELRQIVSLNFSALCSLSQAALLNPAFRRGGTLLNIGSLGGICPMPLDATYSATKAAVHTFTEAVAVEVADNPELDVRVQVAKLGGLKTGWNERSIGPLKPGVELDPNLERLKNDPAVAARRIWAQSCAGRRTVLYDSPLTRALATLFGLFPKHGSRWVYRSYRDESARRGSPVESRPQAR